MKICPKCGGTEVGCSVCDLPPRREKPQIPKVRSALNSLVRLSQDWEVTGIDISAWNGIMDFSITKTKCQFAIVRLGYGNEWKDSRCDTYRRDLIANDMPYGVYWYCKAGEDPVAHAENFAEVASEFPFQLGAEEDFEQTSKNPSETLSWIIAFDTKLKTILGKKTSPYSSAGFWNSYVAPNTYFTDEQWAAHWTLAGAPYMPRNWVWKKGCKWQWSADHNGKAREYGMVTGGDADMDLNRYYGSCSDFNTRYGTHISPLNPIPPGEQHFEFVITANALNVRTGPGTNYSIVGVLYQGNIVELKDIAGTNAWMQIESGQYAGKWCAVKVNENKYMQPK